MKTILPSKILVVLISILFFAIAGCEEKDLYNTKQEDEIELSTLKSELNKMTNQFACENSADWNFVAIGAQSCGGPTGFIAYSKKIDETAFLDKVNSYTKKQQAFNIKWKILSNCALLAAPKSIECVSGKPKFVY